MRCLIVISFASFHRASDLPIRASVPNLTSEDFQAELQIASLVASGLKGRKVWQCHDIVPDVTWNITRLVAAPVSIDRWDYGTDLQTPRVVHLYGTNLSQLRRVICPTMRSGHSLPVPAIASPGNNTENLLNFCYPTARDATHSSLGWKGCM